MREWIIVCLLTILLPASALATGKWDSAPGVAGRFGNSAVNCVPATDMYCFYDVLQATASTLVTPIINMSNCENFSFSWSGNIAVNTDFDNDIECFELMTSVIEASDHGALKLNNATLDGDPSTDTDTSAVRGTDAVFVYCRAAMATASSTGRLRMSCWPRK